MGKTCEAKYTNKGVAILKEKAPLSKETLLLNLDDSFNTCDCNYRALLKAQDEYLKDHSMCNPKDTTKINVFLRQFSCLLHNYLASTYTFFEHTRAIFDKMGILDFKKAYEQRKKEFDSEEVNAFVKDLRRFAQHRRLPLVGAGANMLYTIEGVIANEPCGVIKDLPSLRIDDLVKYDTWSAKSKSFLKRQYRAKPHWQELEIMPFVSVSYKNISGLYRWVQSKIRSW